MIGCAAPGAADEHADEFADADLSVIIDAWPTLPPAAKQQIRGLVLKSLGHPDTSDDADTTE